MDLRIFKLILPILFLFFGYSIAQDHSSFYFDSQPQHQERFIPSSSFPQFQPPPRNNFFSSNSDLSDQSSSFHHGLGQQKIINNNNNNGSPGSYHEQFLYLPDEATTPSIQSSPFQFQQFQPTRAPDYFDFPPRVYNGNPQSVLPLGHSSIPQLSLSGQSSFPRSQAVRPNGNTGFILQKPNNGGQLNSRNQNASLKQNHFLQQFDDQQLPQEQQQQNYFEQSKIEASVIVKPTISTTIRSNSNQFNKFNNQSKNKNFSSSNRFKPTTSTDNQQQQESNEEFLDANQRQQLPYKASKNRFQSNPRYSTTQTPFVSKVQSPPQKQSDNRFNSNKGRTVFTSQKQNSLQNSNAAVQQSNNPALIFNSQRSRFASTSSSSSSLSNNSKKFNQNIPKRTVFISREPNESINPKSQNKIVIDHNGSDKNLENNEFQKFGQKMNTTRKVQSLFSGQDELIRTVETLPLKESSVTFTPVNQSSSSTEDTIKTSEEKTPVILTSNFYLPSDLKEDYETDQKETEIEESVKNYDFSTSKPLEYDYEYEEYDEEIEADTESTIDLKDINSELVKEQPPNYGLNITTEKNNHEFMQATTFRRNFDRLTENPLPLNVSQDPENYETSLKDQTNSETDANTEISTDLPTTTTYLNPISSRPSPSSISDNEELLDYDEEYEDLDSSGQYTGEEENSQQKPNTSQNDNKHISQQIVSVVTTKSVINGSISKTELKNINASLDNDENNIENSTTKIIEASSTEPKTQTEISNTEIYNVSSQLDKKSLNDLKKEENENEKNKKEEILNNSTEGYVVIASIQTSRSINGARFLPFPAIEQEEKKQPFSELEKKIHGPKTKTTKKSIKLKDQNVESNERITTKDVLTKDITTMNSIVSNENRIEITTLPSLENLFSKTIPDNKLNPILENKTDKFPIINMDGPILNSSITKFVPNIKKFVPKTSTVKSKLEIEELPLEEFSSLLPTDYKQRTNSYLNKRKSTTEPNTKNEKINRNDSISRSIKNHSTKQELKLSDLLPKDYKLNESTTESSVILKDILSKIKLEEYQDKQSKQTTKGNFKSTSKPFKTTQEDVGKYLPQGFNKFRLPPSLTSTTKKPLTIVPLKEDVSSSLLPPGYKMKFSDKNPTTTKKTPIYQNEREVKDGRKLPPPGLKIFEKDDEMDMIDISKLFMNEKSLKMKNTSSPSHHVFEAQDEDESHKISDVSHKSIESTKVIFPKSINKRPRITTVSPPAISIGPPPPPITIKKGPPMRATTEFTGWPTPSTTPLSIEKLLEKSKIETFDIFEYLSSTTTARPTTTTTTSTTTPLPPKPTVPGHCLYDCDLAATIKIVDGVQWRPELLDHNTLEWKNLAREIEIQLNEVYKNAPMLKKWYKKIRIDSFNKGSVLVDYFVELTNITENVDTLELKRLFHDALIQTPLTIIPSSSDDDNYEEYKEGKGEKLIKETFMLGRFIIDPLSTDFIVQPKSQFVDSIDLPLIPQWAIVLIVIGVGSLAFTIIFGVAVLINRQKNSKKTPTPLTADMLNELNKDHMGGIENFGADDFYNVEDNWDENKQPIKPKRLSTSVHGNSQTNIYDSWGSNHNHGEYFYNEQKDYVENDPYQKSHPHYKIANPYSTDPVWDAHQMYTYNSRPRYHRDHYDPDF